MRLKVIPIIIDELGTVLKGLERGFEELKTRDHPDYNIGRIEQNPAGEKLLPLLPGPLWPGLVAPDRALSMG